MQFETTYYLLKTKLFLLKDKPCCLQTGGYKKNTQNY